MFAFTGEIVKPDGLVLPFRGGASVPVARVPKLAGIFRRFFPFSITHSTTIRNSLCNTVVDAFDVGSTNGEGRIKIQTAGHATDLAIIPMDAPPAFSAASGGVATGNGLPWTETAAIASGTAAVFDAIDRDNAVVLQGEVALANSDIVLANLSITANDVVRLSTCSYAAPL